MNPLLRGLAYGLAIALPLDAFLVWLVVRLLR